MIAHTITKQCEKEVFTGSGDGDSDSELEQRDGATENVPPPTPSSKRIRSTSQQRDAPTPCHRRALCYPAEPSVHASVA